MPGSHHGDSKRIAKNTIFLYIRMLVMVAISLYTSRLVLEELGITDYGLYNVIGGLITVFSFVNNSMAQASQRYITFEVGTGRPEALRRVFSTCVYLHLIIACVIVLLGETVGLWYVYKVAVIPPDRFKAALWVYQCSIIVAATTIITVPYNALIIAHERMSAFAYLSIVEAALKLTLVFLLMVIPYDKLIVYGLMMAFVAVLMRLFYGLYSKKEFPETKLERRVDKAYIRDMGKFAGWSFWGSLAAAGYTQGLNLLINLFFAPAVNAARGIAVTIQAVVRNFANNFQVAVNPQITKSYATNDLNYMHSLIYRASLFSFSLFYIVALPVFLEINTVLSLWLVQTPPYTSIFIRILLLISTIELLASPLNVSAQATGDIKKFEVTIGVILLLIVPISYIVLKISPRPENVFLVYLFQVCVAQLARLFLMRSKIGLSLRKYFNNVVLKVIFVALIGLSLPTAVHLLINNQYLRLIVVVLTCMSFTPCIVYFIGLNKTEQSLVKLKINQFVSKWRSQKAG